MFIWFVHTFPLILLKNSAHNFSRQHLFRVLSQAFDESFFPQPFTNLVSNFFTSFVYKFWPYLLVTICVNSFVLNFSLHLVFPILTRSFVLNFCPLSYLSYQTQLVFKINQHGQTFRPITTFAKTIVSLLRDAHQPA